MIASVAPTVNHALSIKQKYLTGINLFLLFESRFIKRLLSQFVSNIGSLSFFHKMDFRKVSFCETRTSNPASDPAESRLKLIATTEDLDCFLNLRCTFFFSFVLC